MRLYIGKVSKLVDKKTFVVEFYIPGIYSSSSDCPTAVPLTYLCRSVKIDDEIMVIQPNDDLEIYYYINTATADNEVRLQYGDSSVSINSDGEINIKAKKSIIIDSPYTLIKGKNISMYNGLTTGFSTGMSTASRTMLTVTDASGILFETPSL